MNKIETVIQIELRDLKEFNTDHYRRNPFTKFTKIASVFFFIIFLSIFALDPRNFWNAGLGAIIMLVMGFGIFPLLVVYRSKKNFETEKNYSHPIKISISKQQVTLKGQFTSSSTDLYSFHKFHETKNLILMYANKFGAIIIPKRDLTDDQINITRQILNLKKN